MKKPRMLLWRTFSDLTPVARRMRLEPGHDAAAVLLQAARLVELRRDSPRARSRRRARRCGGSSTSAAASAASRSTADRAQLAGDAAQLLGQAHARAFAGQQPGARGAAPQRRRARPPRSRGEPRPKPSRDTARGDVGRRPAALARRSSRSVSLIDQEADGVEPAIDRASRRAAGSPAAPPARARRRRSRCDRWRRAGCPASRPTASAPAPGWRGSAASMSRMASEPERRGGRRTGARPDLRQLDVLEQPRRWPPAPARVKLPKPPSSATPSAAS